MIDLHNNSLKFSFPQVHAGAQFRISFQRTLRVPDDGTDYPLPAGLGRFPLRHVDGFADRIPPSWRTRGGVMLPMHAAEAMWIDFSAHDYPFAVKIAAGMINAVTGERWQPGLRHGRSPSEQSGPGPVQDYLVLPDQPWLDGFNVGSGRIRQFVAVPLGSGWTAEEQLTGSADVGGLQILAYPMKAAAYEELLRSRPVRGVFPGAVCCMAAPVDAFDMGLGAGGRIRQDISADKHSPDVWDLQNPARCFVHLANSEQWAAITSEAPPTQPPTAHRYRAAGIPWFSFYAEGDVLPGSQRLAQLRSVATLAAAAGEALPDNDPIAIDRVRDLTPRPPAVARTRVRESQELL